MAKQRRAFHDGPVEAEPIAREKLIEAGFHPDKIGDETADMRYWSTTPMIHFCREGDLKMCRYLLAHGASTTSSCDCDLSFPMYEASQAGNLEVCKWLYNNGAKKDIRRENRHSYTPLAISVDEWSTDRTGTSRWLILKGALCRNDDSFLVDQDVLRRDLRPKITRSADDDAVTLSDERTQLLEWAEEAVSTHDAFRVFLLGTLTPPAFTTSLLHQRLSARLDSDDAADMIIGNMPHSQRCLLWNKVIVSRFQSLLQCFSGKLGILETIADYVGVKKGRDLRILRQVAHLLPAFIKDEPV